MTDTLHIILTAYASSLGLDAWVGTNLTAVMSACMFVGKIALGFCGDYVGRLNMTVLCAIVSFIAHFAIWLTASTQAALWAFVVVYGLFGGAYIAVSISIVGQVVGDSNINVGTGWCYFAWSWTGLFGQAIASAISNRTSPPDYRGAIIFNGALFVAGAFLAIILRVMVGGWKIMRVV